MIKVTEGFFSYWWDGGVIKCLFAISAAGVGLAILLASFHTSATIALGLIGLSVIAFLNGANDLPKSVATLTGSGTVAAPGALALGIVATLLGGLLSLFWAGQLVNLFSVGGITSVDSGTIPAFPLAVIASAVTWLLIATKRGIPISTTHTLVGASVGAAGAVAQSGGVNWDSLALVVMAPLLGGPLAAGLVGYGLSRTWRSSKSSPSRHLCTRLHLLSAVGASVARALNDTPKIVGVGLLALELGGSSSNPIPKELLSALVSLAMVAGGFWASKLVMHTLAFRVTDLNLYSGVTANLTNWSLVSAGSFLGLPLSTTHVSGAAMVGSVYGTRCHKVRWKVVKNVSNAWLITVPATAVLAVIFSVIAQGLYAIF